MKKNFILTGLFAAIVFCATAQFKKDGTPDMRYSANKQLYGTTYSTSGYGYGTNTQSRYQSGYVKSNGTYVEPHYKTVSNNTNWDNYSTKSNSNPYTLTTGYRARDYSGDAYNYGAGRQIETGPRGGQYYINSYGNKIYVPKR